MHLHRHTIDNLRDRRGRGLFNRSYFLWLRRHEDADESAQFSTQLVLGLVKPRLSFRLHVGTRGSETPLDAHLDVLGNAVYVNTSIGRRLAHALSRGVSKTIAFRLEDGKLWYTLWANEHSYRRGDRRQGALTVSPAELLWGPKRYSYEDLAVADVEITMPDGQYPVTLTLQRCRYGRARRRLVDQGYVVDWNAPRGIPTHFDHSGGWKGDRTYGSAIALPERRNDWPADAGQLLMAWVMEQRGRTGFRAAQEQTR